MSRATWLRRITTLVTTATMAGFGVTGIASAQTITNTGPNSTNIIRSTVKNDCTIRNNNNVSLKNQNRQYATSGDATVKSNTIAGGSWDGWGGLDPDTAKADGVSFDSWRSGVTDWMAGHSGGDGWDSSGDNLSWAPSGNDWSSFDPMTWQDNGQSFDNWDGATQAFLDHNNPTWLLGWPADATGSGHFGSGGATSGNAVNNNNSNFSININNSVGTAAALKACLQAQAKAIVQPPVSVVSAPGVPSISKVAAPGVLGAVTPGVGAGGFGAGPGAGVGQAARAVNIPGAPARISSAPGAPPSKAVAVAAAPPSISATGPNSVNVVSSKVSNNVSVKNNNNICVTNASTQSASTGDATVKGNTIAGDASSGGAANGNGTGVGAGLSN